MEDKDWEHCTVFIRCLSMFTKTLCTSCTMSIVHCTVSTIALKKAFHILNNVDDSLDNVRYRFVLLRRDAYVRAFCLVFVV